MRNNNNDDLPTTVTIQDCPPWFEMLEMFQYEIDRNPRREAKIISVCFKHGYTLNLTDIFNTSTSASFPDREHNVLDLGNHPWTISDKKNIKRTIDVSPAFVEEISKYIEIKDFWLLYKTTGMPYSTCLLSSIGIDAFKSNDVRNSWEIYQREKSQPEPEPEPEHICEPHPLHIENPDKYTVSGKIRVVAKPKSLIVTDTMEVWSSGSE
jgi:hypothetical protein